MRYLHFAALALAAPAAAQGWTSVPLPTTAFGFETDPSNADHLLVIRNDLQVWHETFDGGLSWTVLQDPALSSGVVRSWYSIDSAGNVICTLLRTQNAVPLAGPVALIRQGSTWQPIGPDRAPAPFGRVEGTGVVRGMLNPDLLVLGGVEPDSFGGSPYMHVSTDGGATWGPEIMSGGFVSEIVEAASGPYLVGSFTGYNPTSFTVVSRSTGLGALDQFLFGESFIQLGFSPRFPDAMWIVSSVFDSPNEIQTFSRSTDGGATWTALDTYTGTEWAAGLTVHPTRPDCAVLWRSRQEMEITTDGGLTFEGLGVPYVPLAFVEEGRTLYATSGTATGAFLHRAELFPTIGAPECSAQINSSGAAASIEAMGSRSVAENDLTLAVTDVGPNQFGYFVVSTDPGFVPNPGGSFGNLCLTGTIGRYTRLTQDAGPYGQFFGAIDLTAIPGPNGMVAAQAGQTWRFQAWFRDVLNGVSGSNFSNAVAVTFVP